MNQFNEQNIRSSCKEQSWDNIAYFNNIKHQPPSFSPQSINQWMVRKLTEQYCLFLPKSSLLLISSSLHYTGMYWSLPNLIHPNLRLSIKQNPLSLVPYSVI